MTPGPRHLTLAILGALFLLFLGQNGDLFLRENSVTLRFLSWKTRVRPVVLVVTLPLAGFAAGYLARAIREASRKQTREERHTPSAGARSDEEPPRLRRPAARAEDGAEAGRPEVNG